MPNPERELETSHLVADIGRRSVRGGIITLGAQGFKVALQFGAVVALARLLPPAAFGLIAMVAALSTLLDLVKELGLSAATIRRSDLTHGQVSALFWINTAMGALLAAGLFLVAPIVARFYAQPALLDVTRCLALAFLLSGLSTQHWALLRRQMRFGAVAVIETGSETVGFAVAIGLALGGADYWALVAQRLAGPVLAFVGCWTLCRWRPSWPARAAGVHELLGYGLSVTGCNIATAVTRSLDQVLIGWLWGPYILGLYERASKLLLLPINNINVPLYAVAMPALSRVTEQHKRYRRAFLEMFEKLAMITIPAGVLVAITADWVVALLFGRQWGAVTPLVACFAAAAAYQPVMLAVGLLYLTQNRPGEMLRAALTDSALSLAAILMGLPFGATAVAASLAATGLALRAPAAFWLATRRGPVVLGDVAAGVFPSALAALAVAATTYPLHAVLQRYALAPAGAFALAALAALSAASITYCAVPRSRRALIGLAHLGHSFRKEQPSAQV